jgi:hypothetical protein
VFVMDDRFGNPKLSTHTTFLPSMIICFDVSGASMSQAVPKTDEHFVSCQRFIYYKLKCYCKNKIQFDLQYEKKKKQ